MIDAYASLPHYAAHLRPVWEALPPEQRGTLYLGPRVGSPTPRQPPGGPGPLTLVASWADLDQIRPRRVILMEHGAGQSYSDRHSAYAGGLERETVDLFLCPGPHSAERNAAAYPAAPVVQTGCPALDDYLKVPSRLSGQMVAVSWHRNHLLHPETHWAWNTFHPALPLLTRRFPLVGHGHPRARSFFKKQYRRFGIRWAEWGEVMERASVLVVDNSSAGFEFAATGRPVVWMNAPGYRRGVEHGLRFWGNVGVGYQCDEPARLPDVVEEALGEPAWKRDERLSLTPYSHLDGRSAARAAVAIVSVLGESEAA